MYEFNRKIVLYDHLKALESIHTHPIQKLTIAKICLNELVSSYKPGGLFKDLEMFSDGSWI